MTTRRLSALLCVLPALALAACGDDDEDSGGSGSSSGGGGGTVNVYSSLPLQGASQDQTKAMVQGIELSLEQNQNKAGDITVKYESLDDSTAQAGTWTPEAVQANAGKVARDSKAAFYIGEFNSGASALSIPVLNEAGIPQLSPANTAVGLTTDEPGADPGTPEKYYPAGTRTFARIVPKDTIQGAALTTLMKEDGCTMVAVANDKEVYGAGLARNIELAAEEQGLELVGNEGIDTKAANYRSLAQRFEGQGADCFIFSGITANNAVQIYKDVSSAIPDAKLYGPDGVAESGFADPKKGGIPKSVGDKIKLTAPAVSPDDLPPEGQAFFAEFKTKYGEDNPDPYAIYGYEAMQLALDAIKRSGTGKKEDVLKALFATKDRQSVLGTYSIDENGDTTSTDYGLRTVKDGELEIAETIKGAAN